MELPLDIGRIVYSYMLMAEVPHIWECALFRSEVMSRLPVLPYLHKQELSELELDAFIAYILIHKKLPTENAVLARQFYSELPLCVRRLVLLYDTNEHSYYTRIEFSNNIPSVALSLDMSTLSFGKGEVGDRLLTSAIMYTFDNENTATFNSLKRKTPPHAIIQDHVPFIEYVIPYIHPSEFNRYAFEALYHNNERAFRVLWPYCTQFDLTLWSRILCKTLQRPSLNDITKQLVNKWQLEDSTSLTHFVGRYKNQI